MRFHTRVHEKGSELIGNSRQVLIQAQGANRRQVDEQLKQLQQREAGKLAGQQHVRVGMCRQQSSGLRL